VKEAIMRNPLRGTTAVSWGTALLIGGIIFTAGARTAGQTTDIDAQVTAFLKKAQGNWHDLNIPEEDGKAMFDIIVKHGYKHAVEVGTSTGHSGIWLAWALSKTGGKLITIEIDQQRHQQALQNFKDAGVSAFVDARLADAHVLVPQLEGPVDFVFLDADKEWYTKYAKALMPKLAAGGCLTGHNVGGARGGKNSWKQEFFEYLESVPGLKTTVLEVSRAGLSVSYKK
jgi:predicted O-methyltransferase YrrM